MNDNWLWDRKFSISQAKKILKDPSHKDFTLLASLLLSRNNEPKAIFAEYLDRETFCRYWPDIKKVMRKDDWNDPRLIFWQAIYENLAARYRQKGLTLRKHSSAVKPVYSEVGKRLAGIRKEQGISQKDLADKMGVSQQLVSRIEKGRENISLSTLKAIARALGKRAVIDFLS